MTSTKTTDERAEVQGRLDGITARIQTRTGEIGDIERRQLAAATAGEDSDPALATAKAALVDAQSIDQRAAAAVRGQLDQLDAAAARERDLKHLAALRAQVAEKRRAAQEEAGAYPAAVGSAVEALKAAATDLVDRRRRIQAAAVERERLAEAANTLAQKLGEPVVPEPVTEHWSQGQRVVTPEDTVYPAVIAAAAGLSPTRAKVFHAAGRTVADTAAELAEAIKYGPRER
jgi:chromosome segregation ATPase